MKNANYADSWVDITLPGSGYALKVQRFYNSRSIFIGMFGFGWCSEFETTLEKTPEGRLKLAECGAGQEVIYTASNVKFDPKAFEATIDQMVAAYKKATANTTAQSLQDFRGKLHDDAELRLKWAKNAGITIPEVKKGSVFKADGFEVEQITFDGGVYTRTLADGTLQKFNSDGHMTYMYDRNGNFLKISYADNLIKEIIDNNGRKLSLSYFPNKRVKEILAPGGTKTEYKYKGEDLAEVHNMWKNKYTYNYDETHNLKRIDFPDGTFKALTYDQKHAWVTSFTDRAVKGVACVENYKYEFDQKNAKDHFWSTATKKCGTEVKNEARFEFWLRNRTDGSRFLSRVLTQSFNDSLDVMYHPENGRPVSVKRNNVLTTLEYYPNGLVHEKSSGNVHMLFEYKNQFNKISKVTTEFFDSKGKVARRRDTEFQYDSKANLVAANNSDGQAIKLTYDDRGRIASIVDQAKKEVLIKYEEHLGKPAQITRPTVGSIAIRYKANGEIEKITSPDGPTAAVQIAATFNNLLDIIAPATSEITL
jgi:YD repeat-containing protein